MISIKKDDCCGCHACDNICPKDAIKMTIDEEGFWYPNVDNAKCIKCGACEIVCPAINPLKTKSLKKAYASYNKDSEVRIKSSSGGIFTALSGEIIKNNGIVFGASFNDEYEVIHIGFNKIDEISCFRGSKYVQSKIGYTYREVKENLEYGKNVLFSGTPCQIDGLKSYLRKDYNNLICTDLICHGVPSPKVWKMYLKEISKNKEILSMTFRDKTLGWKEAILRYSFKDGSEHKEKYSESKYIKGFIQNCYLRPSCYKCKFKTLNRGSDITLADFWGVESILPNIDSKYGVSLLIVHTQKGKDILAKINENIFIEEVDINSAIQHNSCAIKSVELTNKRKRFYKFLERMSVSDSINKSIKIPLVKLICRKIKYELENIRQIIVEKRII